MSGHYPIDVEAYAAAVRRTPGATEADVGLFSLIVQKVNEMYQAGRMGADGIRLDAANMIALAEQHYGPVDSDFGALINAIVRWMNSAYTQGVKEAHGS